MSRKVWRTTEPHHKWAQRIASEVAASVWSVQEEKVADELTLRGHSIGGDDDVIDDDDVIE